MSIFMTEDLGQAVPPDKRGLQCASGLEGVPDPGLKTKMRRLTYLVSVVIVSIVAAGCTRDTSGLDPWPIDTDPDVFIDNFGSGVDFYAFRWSDVNALSQDPDGGLEGTNSLRISVPGPGAFAGGAFASYEVRDLTGYNALTFWARASRADTFDIVGLGNDNTGTSKYEAGWSDIPLTTNWKKFIVPIPLPAKLGYEQGLFFFADAVPDGGTGYEVWFDNVRFERVSGISNPRPSMTQETLEPFLGATVEVKGTQVVFDVNGSDQVINHLPGYFTFTSSDDEVAAITRGQIKVVGVGTAVITAKLDTLSVSGKVTLNTTAAPATPAPTPTEPAGDVISLFSNAPGYENVTVDTWAAYWTGASHEVADFKVAGDDVKVYTNLTFAGIEFVSETIDAREMNYFHMDIWVPEGTQFRVKLVDFGEDGVYGGAPDSEHELTFGAASTPPLVTESWVSLDMHLTEDFTRLRTRGHLAQLIIAGNTRTVFMDNVYFHK
jgi:hypothetical protein